MLKEKLVTELNTGKWNRYMQAKTRKYIENSTVEEIEKILDEITAVPIIYSRPVISSDLFRIYFIFTWLEVFKQIELKKEGPAVLEVASGSTDPVPQALDIYAKNGGKYVTANLNKDLTAGLKSKTNNLKIEVNVVEDYAANLADYYQPESFQIATFQHAINDIIQTIVADKMGIDTVNQDWFAILPAMVKGVTTYYQQGKLKEIVFTDFIKEIGICYQLLEPGGYLAFNTHVFQMDLDCGYPLELYGSFVLLARDWLNQSEMDLKEIRVEGFDPDWWLFYQKV